MSELTEVIDGLTTALERERTKLSRLARDACDQHDEIKRLRALTRESCAKGMAAIATYGRRDENGLTGLSRQHFRELGTLQDQIEPQGAGSAPLKDPP